MLLGNYNVFNANPGRALGGITNPTYWFHGGTLFNQYVGEAVVSGQTNKYGLPAGYSGQYAFSPPPKSGGLASKKEARIAISQVGNAVMGLPASGSAAITLTITATGGLIVSGSGSASISISATGDIKSIASASGSASISISTSAALGALAGLSGSATITFTPTATMHAIGYLSGTSSNETEFSADALARAVWDALATDFNLAGTMGEKLNAAGSAGDPWGTALPGSYADGTAGKIIGSKLLTTGKFLGLK